MNQRGWGRSRTTASFLLLLTLAACSGQQEQKPEGLRLLEAFGCTTCHSTDGSQVIGPTFQGIYGKSQTVHRDGAAQQVTVDEEYLRRSILDPRADLVKGFPATMPTRFKNQITEQELEQIVSYIKTL